MSEYKPSTGIPHDVIEQVYYGRRYPFEGVDQYLADYKLNFGSTNDEPDSNVRSFVDTRFKPADIIQRLERIAALDARGERYPHWDGSVWDSYCELDLELSSYNAVLFWQAVMYQYKGLLDEGIDFGHEFDPISGRLLETYDIDAVGRGEICDAVNVIMSRRLERAWYKQPHATPVILSASDMREYGRGYIPDSAEKWSQWAYGPWPSETARRRQNIRQGDDPDEYVF